MWGASATCSLAILKWICPPVACSILPSQPCSPSWVSGPKAGAAVIYQVTQFGLLRCTMPCAWGHGSLAMGNLRLHATCKLLSMAARAYTTG